MNNQNNPPGMSKALTSTDYRFPGLVTVYHGKVRDVYNIGNRLLVMVATDRISAFDVVLPRGIPYKGQVLNQIASHFLDATSDIVPNWKIASPDPNVTVGHLCNPLKVEMVIRGYLAGHAWRLYQSGHREISGVPMPEGMVENQSFPHPIITPTTKAAEGHDEDISREMIIRSGLADPGTLEKLEEYTRLLYRRGTEMARSKGLILADTKYEFGMKNGEIFLIDEIHTPDSSRYFYADGYTERLRKGEEQKQLSKEFVRQWLINNGFQGKSNQVHPPMSDDFVESVSERYIELYEKITGEPFIRSDISRMETRIENSIRHFLPGIEDSLPTP